jgi:hypothetical protein
VNSLSHNEFNFPIDILFVMAYSVDIKQMEVMKMEKREFQALALRGNAEIGPMMYESIERYYMSNNDYHERHGGVDESKEAFVKRVFGGKVNTPKTIAEKMAAESIRENRWALRGNSAHDKKTLDHYDTLIEEHYMGMFKYGM